MDKTKAIKIAKILKCLITLSELSTIINTFFKAFLEKPIPKDATQITYLFGNFNLGGTLSGRMSSSKINLQNLPSSGSIYSKIVKECFVAPEGWLFVGIDFDSLEDKVSALTTKDPNKIRVYTDGYDGHCLRAYAYFGSQMPDISNTVISINSIKNKYPNLRQDSKVPTFALTYDGTWRTLVKNIGMSEKQAKSIESNYHELYKVSDEWVHTKLVQASIDGYVTTAFGLRVRTPILNQVIFGAEGMPKEAAGEGRTAGNALGQGYGLLNNRAGIEFQEKLFESEFKHSILPIAHIHDAQYFLVKQDIDTLHWFNKTIVKCVSWQELPELVHSQVKLSGACELFYPSWANPHDIPVEASRDDIAALFTTLNL